MQCKKITELINKYIDKRISQAELLVMQEHLKSCKVCKRKLEYLEKIGEVLSEGVTPPMGLKDAVISRIVCKDVERRPLVLTALKLALIPSLAVVLIILATLFKHGQTSVTVTFNIEVPGATNVYLVGDFNGWEVGACKLKRHDGKWSVTLSLPPGRYQYAFVIDGKKWIADPNAKQFVDNGYGLKNSILDITRI